MYQGLAFNVSNVEQDVWFKWLFLIMFQVTLLGRGEGEKETNYSLFATTSPTSSATPLGKEKGWGGFDKQRIKGQASRRKVGLSGLSRPSPTQNALLSHSVSLSTFSNILSRSGQTTLPQRCPCHLRLPCFCLSSSFLFSYHFSFLRTNQTFAFMVYLVGSRYKDRNLKHSFKKHN